MRDVQTKRPAQNAPASPFALILSELAVAASAFAHHPGAGYSSIAILPPDVLAESSQSSPKTLGQLMPRTPQPRLQRIFRHAKFLRRFSRRVTLDLAQHKRRAQQRRKLIQIRADHFAQFRPRKHLLRVRSLRRETLHDRQFVLARWFVERNRRPRLRASPPHQRRVDHNARQPRRKLRPPFESLQIPIRRKQSVLERIFRIFRVSQHAQRRLKQRPVITLKKYFHRLRIAALPGSYQFVFVERRPISRRSSRSNCTNHCRLCRHLVPHSYKLVTSRTPKNFLPTTRTRLAKSQCTGTSAPALPFGLLSISSTGITAKKTTPSNLKLSMNASITACRCTVP